MLCMSCSIPYPLLDVGRLLTFSTHSLNRTLWFVRIRHFIWSSIDPFSERDVPGNKGL
jgi:hypothetical protein